MPPQPRASLTAVKHSASLLALALWAGIVTGLAEVAVIVGPLFGPDYAKRSRDAVWMIPTFDGALFVGLGGLLVVVGFLVRIRWTIAAGLFAGCGGLLVLLLFPQLHPAAVVIVAVGIGVQTVRLTGNRAARAAGGVRRTLPWLIGFVAVLAGAMLGWQAREEHARVEARGTARAGAPNVLLLILDTVRAADLSLYGYGRRTSPELDRFAERGTVFDQAFAAASWTAPSHASMFTGRWTVELDVTGVHSLSARWPTLAETLQHRGYATAAFVANQVYAGWESGVLRGFEHREDYPVSLWTAAASSAFGLGLYPSIRHTLRPLLNRVPLLWRLRLPPADQRPSAEDISGAFVRWLDHSRPTPFFAFLNFMDAHLPYTSPDSFRFRYRSTIPRPVSPAAFRAEPPKIRLTPADLRPKQDAYDGSITYLDSQLGRLLRELDRRRLLDSTLVIIVGDHGDEFAEHGLVDHGNSLYRLSLQVPLVVAFPGHVPADRRVAAPVTLRNLAATVLDLVDADSAILPGRSLARFWTETDAAPDTIIAGVRCTGNLPRWFPVSRGDLNSIAFDGLRYIRNEGDGGEELYDFEHDVLERWNLLESDSGRRIVPRYRAALAAVTGRADKSHGSGVPELCPNKGWMAGTRDNGPRP
jgi:arylsulfatase A-like enzyme